MQPIALFTQQENLMKNKIALFSALAGSLICSFSMAQRPTAETSTTRMESDYYGLQRPHIGVTAGVSTPEGNYDSAGEIGMNFGYQPFVPLGLGASISTVRNAPRDNRQDIERTAVLGRGTYNFGGSNLLIKHSWMGFGLGPVFSDDGTDFAAAPIIGFDIPVNQDLAKSYFSLGAEAKYLVVSNNQPDNFTLNGAIKFWY
jgi:hypothetical protein